MALPIRERTLVIEAWFDLLLVVVVLRTPLHRRLMRYGATVSDDQRALLEPERGVQLVNAAARFHIRKMTCLERALVTQRVLHRRGTKVTLRIGVRRAAGEIEAHAWIEHNGTALDPIASQYAVMGEPGA